MFYAPGTEVVESHVYLYSGRLTGRHTFRTPGSTRLSTTTSTTTTIVSTLHHCGSSPFGDVSPLSPLEREPFTVNVTRYNLRLFKLCTSFLFPLTQHFPFQYNFYHSIKYTYFGTLFPTPPFCPPLRPLNVGLLSGPKQFSYCSL